MILTNDMYVPALRWRQGEYQALLRLSNQAKERVVPFITIPDLEFDFETWEPKKSVQEHVHPFAARYKAKWNTRPAWVGVHKNIINKSMADNRDIFTYVFEELRAFEANAIPAITLDADTAIIQAVAAIVKKDGQGLAIVVRLEDLMKSKLRARVDTLVSALGAELSDIDLIVDLGAPNFEPYTTFADALITALGRLGDMHMFRNAVLIGTAIPKSFKDIAKGADNIPRHDWLFYQTFVARLTGTIRRPNYGDYTIVHPDFKAIDMRKFKPAGKLIYTTTAHWAVRKGGAFRDDPKQMHGHCASIVNTDMFKGAGYSKGDAYIADCAAKKEGPSSQTRWKDIAINHHITHVLDDLSMLSSAS